MKLLKLLMVCFCLTNLVVFRLAFTLKPPPQQTGGTLKHRLGPKWGFGP